MRSWHLKCDLKQVTMLVLSLIRIYIFTLLFHLFRWAAGTSRFSGSYRDVHAGMPGPGTLGQLLDASNLGNIPAAQIAHVQLWISEGVGSQGQTPQWTHSDQSLEKWKWAVRAFWWQEAVWERRGTLHRQWQGWYPTGESEVLPASLLPRQPKGAAAIRGTLNCPHSWTTDKGTHLSSSRFICLSFLISSHLSWCFCSVIATYTM